jgi:hypothetical protein
LLSFVGVVSGEEPVPGAPDLAGTWQCCGAGGAAAQNFVITSGRGSLTGSGELPSGQVFSAITGSVGGDAVTIVTTYNAFSPGYVATFVGTLSPDQLTITGSWTSNVGQAGAWTATRTAKPPGPLPPSDDATARMQDIDSTKPGEAPSFTVVRDGVTYAGSVNSTLQTGDIITTGPNTIAALEFLIGGRVGINRNTEIVMVNERAVRDGKVSLRTLILKNGSLWVKADAKALKEPIEIQTNGGVMGIKG